MCMVYLGIRKPTVLRVLPLIKGHNLLFCRVLGIQVILIDPCKGTLIDSVVKEPLKGHPPPQLVHLEELLDLGFKVVGLRVSGSQLLSS